MFAEKGNQLGHWCLVADHLRHAEECRLERGCAAGDEGCGGVGEQRVCLVADEADIGVAQELLVKFIVDGRCAGEHQLVVGHVACSLNHGKKVVLDFLTAAAGEQRDDGARVERRCERGGLRVHAGNELRETLIVTLAEAAHLVCGRVAHVMDGEVVLLLKERSLEGKDGEQFADIALDVLDAVFFPCPYLGRYIVVNGDARLGVYELRDVEVEARIIDQYHHVGLPFRDVALAESHVPEDGPQVEQHGDEAHVRHLLVVLDACAADGSHQVAAEETELCLRVFVLERLHEM